MILLDIGNTTVGVWDDGAISHIPAERFKWSDFPRCFYICVNEALKPRKSAYVKGILRDVNRFNLEPLFALSSSYSGLGVDRKACCYTIRDGVVVDAGSALTVDFMRNGRHIGGYILPGLAALARSYAGISPRLSHTLNTNVNLQVLPNDTKTAISYGAIKMITTLINSTAANERIYLTGGDSSYLVQHFPQAIVRRDLVFDGMLLAIKENSI